MSCNSRRLIITEQEKNHILSLYNLISEDTSADKNYAVISGNTFFDDGKWKEISETAKSNLISQINNAAKLLVNNKNAFSLVKITAGESQVKNYDKEESIKKPVDPGYLSAKRAETMYKFLYDQFKSLLDQGVIGKIPEFEKPFKTKIGDTKWTKGMSTDNPKYNEERFVTAELIVKKSEECLVGLGIQVVYYKTPNPQFPCRGGHQCDLADFTVNVNKVPIGRVSLNNRGDGGDRVPPKLYITPEMAKTIAANNKNEIVISLLCNTATNCHSSTPEVIITKKDENNTDKVIYNQCAAPMANRGDLKERVLLTLDSCGNVIGKGTMDNENMSKGDKTDLSKILGSPITTTTTTKRSPGIVPLRGYKLTNT